MNAIVLGNWGAGRRPKRDENFLIGKEYSM